ncbi:MAG: sulfatase-like hydrolase/transferase, partial [Planctomycetales bacterium]|nr:sulfatase-like hydrolase/transferase [Planctomycetales bacterium]
RRWGSGSYEKYAAAVADRLRKTIADEELDPAARADAARELFEFQPQQDENVAQVLKQITLQASPELAIGLLEACKSSQAPGLGAAVLSRWNGWTPSVKAAASRLLLSRADATTAMLDAVEAGEFRLTELALDQRQSLANHPSAALRERAKKLLDRGGALPNADRQKVLAEMLPLTERSGDATLGKAVFLKTCAKCHTHSGEGTQIGPDLTGMFTHPKRELLGNIIDPSASVEGNFRTYTLATVSGQVFSGMLAGESKTALELVDTEAKRHTVLREDIEELIASPKSLMPEGFEKQLKPEEFVNLLEFLSRPSRYVPLNLAKAATAVSTKGMFYREDATLERLIFDDWSPKTFDGVPFVLVNPQGDRVPNVVMLHGPRGYLPPKMPASVGFDFNAPAAAIHLLSGVSGWGYPAIREQSVSMIVRLQYADGKTEDHPLRNGVHFADYIREVEVPQSKKAFDLDGRQVRYLTVRPQRTEPISRIEFVKGPDETAPIVMAATVETLAAPAPKEGAAAPRRPNILFAIADDASYPHMGAYGCGWVKTPAFDRVAKNGLLFTRAYTPNAKCAPSRACILTGRNSWQLEEAANHWCFFPAKFKVFTEVLAEHGYRVGTTGKGWAPGVAKDDAGKLRQMAGEPFQTKRAVPPAGGISNLDYAGNFDDFLASTPADQPWCFWYGGYEPHRG